MKEFSTKTVEELRYYVYLLIDPRNDKIFYVGKGVGNRVFAHVGQALADTSDSDKLSQIREIQNEGLEVKHYVVRHKLDESAAFLIESVLIDVLTYNDFTHLNKLTNIMAGHQQWDQGVKTVNELEALYASKPLLEKEIEHNLLAINVNRTYKLKNERHPNIYEATRKSWPLSRKRLDNIDYIVSEYRGVVRAIFVAEKWIKDGKRWMFEGKEVKEPAITQLYLNKALPERKKGSQNPVRYFTKRS